MRRGGSAQQTASKNDQPTPVDANVCVDTIINALARENVSVDTVSMEIEQPTSGSADPTPNSDNLAVSNSASSSGGTENGGSARDVSPEQSNAPGCNSLQDEESSRDVASDESIRRSDKCVEAVSGVTDDSGYMDTSINSMNASMLTNTHSDLTESNIELASLSDDEKMKAGDDANISSPPVLDAAVQCFALTDVVCNISDRHRMEDEGNAEQDTDTTPSTDAGDDHNTPEKLDKDTSASSTCSSSDDTDPAANSDAEEEEEEETLYQRTLRRGIALEHIKRTQDGTAAVGTILVRNDCYTKNVGARHSTDSWASFQDTPAEWVEEGVEGEGEVDRFQFRVPLPEGSYHMELAFFFNEYWDNNDDDNHVVSCTIF